jgi:hypothetical protein
LALVSLSSVLDMAVNYLPTLIGFMVRLQRL